MTLSTEYSIGIRLKVLYFYELRIARLNGEGSFTLIDDLWRRFFLNVLYSITWKRVLSSKYSNRIIVNYFQRFNQVFLNSSYREGNTNTNLISEFTLAVMLLYYLNDVNHHR